MNEEVRNIWEEKITMLRKQIAEGKSRQAQFEKRTNLSINLNSLAIMALAVSLLMHII